MTKENIKNIELFYFSILIIGVLSCNPKSERNQETSRETTLQVEQVKPPYWWVGFESQELQLSIICWTLAGDNLLGLSPGLLK